ncbi:MAG TPA: hypothetical protein VEI48_09965 [Candidatus Sulfotelmatobacter sp.]|nr:hypothetical protein [Candidatus Sulfotelmatobacter sp.]
MPADRLLRALADHSVDLLLTDPPYTSVARHPGSGHLRAWFRGGLDWAAIGRVLALGRRKLKADGVVLVMTNAAGLHDAIGALQRAGFSEVRPITWDRRYPGLGGGLRHQTEFVLLGRLPGSRSLSGVDLVAVAAVGPGTAHRYPTQKPDGLGRILAKMAGVRPGHLVVDPFCGSGALLVGPYERGATVVGGDIAAAAVAQATRRLRPAVQRRSPGPARAAATVGPRRRRP